MAKKSKPFESDSDSSVRELVEYMDAGALGPDVRITGRGADLFEAGPGVDVIFFGTHPDDEVWLAGGTLLSLKKTNLRVATVCVSRGSGGGDTDVRLREYFRINSEFKPAASFILTSGLDSDQARFWEKPFDPDRLAHWGAAPMNVAQRRLKKSKDGGSFDLYDPQEYLAVGERLSACVAQPIAFLIRRFRPRWVFCDREDGSYGHPTHTASHYGVLRAVKSAADPDSFPGQLGIGEVKPHSVKGVIHYQPVGCPNQLDDKSIKFLPLLDNDRPNVSYNTAWHRLEKARIMGEYRSQFPDFWGQRLPMMAILALWGGNEKFSVWDFDGGDLVYRKERIKSLEKLLAKV